MKKVHLLATRASVALAALLLGACVADAGPSGKETTDEPLGEAEQGLIACDGTHELYVQYYSDPGLTNVIGYSLCYCNGGEASGGQRSRYYTVASYACWPGA